MDGLISCLFSVKVLTAILLTHDRTQDLGSEPQRKLRWKQVHKAGSVWTVKVQSHSHLCCVCLVRVLGLFRPCEKSTRLGFHCCLRQNSGYQTELCVSWRKCIDRKVSLPSLSTVVGVCSVCHLCVSQVIHPSSKTWEPSVCFSAQDSPGWWCAFATIQGLPSLSH